MKVAVPRANSAHSVLTKQDGGVGVVNDVAGQVGHLGEDLRRNDGMPISGDHYSGTASNPTMARMSAGVAPAWRSDRRLVSRSDFDSFLPQASVISR